ncbi:hypothetical protein [Blastococcus sp. SYSU D00820]
MTAPTTDAPRFPSARRRGAARGAVLGMGLLVAAGAGMPAAAADDETAAPTTTPAPAPTTEAAGAPLNQAPVPTAPTAADLTADFGLGKNLGVFVEPDGVFPQDLDMSGAEIAFRPVEVVADPTGVEGVQDADGTAYLEGEPTICTTDADGACHAGNLMGWGPLGLAEEGGDTGTADSEADPSLVVLEPGLYLVEQLSSSTGFAHEPGILGTVRVCGFGDFIAVAEGIDGAVPCESFPALSAPNASLFSTAVWTTTLDAVTGAPVPGVAYELTGGPDYPRVPGAEPGDCQPMDIGETPDGDLPTAQATDSGLPVTDAAGDLTFPGCHLPGDRTLRAVGVPAGYQAGQSFTVPVGVPPMDERSGEPDRVVRVTVGLLPVGAVPAPPSTPSTPSVPSTPPAAPTATGGTGSTGGTGARPSTGTGTGTGAGTGARPGSAGTASSPSAPAATGSAPAAPTAPATAASSPSPAKPTPARPSAPTAVSPADDVPVVALETESSTELLEVGLIGFGVLFVAAVVVAIGVLRRRARRQS